MLHELCKSTPRSAAEVFYLFLQLPMISDDIETFNNNEQATEFKQGIDAVYDSS